jgi:hypothetical protein
VIAAATSCRPLGIDRSLGALVLARGREGAASARPSPRVCAQVPSLPLRGPFDVVLLVETFLAFRDKAALLAAVATVLAPRGRFALTCEEGRPLDAAERGSIPGGDTIWLVELVELQRLLAEAGLVVRALTDLTAAHAALARRLGDAFDADRTAISAALGEPALAALLATHQRWAEWLASGRVRKLALVCAPQRLAGSDEVLLGRRI